MSSSACTAKLHSLQYENPNLGAPRKNFNFIKQIKYSISELAYNEYGDEWTASELKDEFIRHGTTFTQFFCAFCDIPVTLAAAYGTDYKRAPYFRLADNLNLHQSDCPHGEKTFASYGIKRPPRAKYEFNVDLPECLIPIPPRRIVSLSLRNELPKLASPDETRKRVLAKKDIANKYTTGLLQTLAKARLNAIKAILELPSVKALAGKEQWAAAFGKLKKCPLSLYGNQLNYNSAFHKTTHVPWKNGFIYYGHNATVEATKNGFLIISSDGIPPSHKTGKEIPANIIVNCDIHSPRNRMEAKSIECLANAQRTSAPITWYAYGELILNDISSAYELTVSEPAHIYTELKK